MSVQQATTDELAELLAHQQITKCLFRYARGVDRCDPDLIRSAFHPDAIDHHGSSINGSPQEFVEYFVPLQSGREVCQHYISNVDIEVAGDEAHVESYFTSISKLRAEAETLRTVGGRYIDRFERRDGEWRIATRVVLAEWTTTDATDMGTFLGQAYQGSRDRADPVYQRPLTGPA